MRSLRPRVISWLGRRYLVRLTTRRFDLSKMPFFPDAALMPLKRDGLDPIVDLGRKREEEPVSKLALPFGHNVWLVTGYDEVKTVLGNVGGYSNDFRNLVGNDGLPAQSNPGGLGFADPPVHTRLRRLLTPEFTMRRLSRLTPRIDAIVAERLEAMAASQGPVDLVQAFAIPIPSQVICELLGVPYEDRESFQRLSMARFDLFGGAGASLGAMSESLSSLLDIVKKQRDSPGDGLLGMLIKEHSDQVDDRELAELADGVLTGGFETTASMLALGAIVLLQNPEHFRLIHDEDSSVNNLVEELLRYLTVVQVAFPRFARHDVEVAGTKISRGDVVLCSLSGANRDQVLGADMERFQPTRHPSPHLAFGYGLHRCIGAELARMELRAAYPALVRRFPDMRLYGHPDELPYRKTSIVYGVDRVPVLLT